MFLDFLLCCILFIPLITSREPTKTMSTGNSSKDELLLNVTNSTIITEGGSTVQSTPPVILSNQNHTTVLNLMDLDKELGNDKITSGSKIKPRKGAPQLENITSTENKTQEPAVQSIAAIENTTVSTVVPHSSTMANNSGTNSTTHKFKKPTVLSNEALDRMDMPNADIKYMPLLQSSTKSNQTGSISTNTPKKVEATINASKHPGMVMPIVITILVVPMFAVLGYMGLRRGKEAWKNRHYKRMDFLLDGMYNE